jgi:hypothetical protein
VSAEDRRAHRRIPAAELLWLQVARIRNGPQVRLVDLSEGGVLLEADTRLPRNSSGLLELVGDGREAVCSFRVLRWQPSPGNRAAQYLGACTFTEPLDLESLLHPAPADAGHVRWADHQPDVADEPSSSSHDAADGGALASFLRRPEDQRERDPRRTRGEVPWLSTVTLPWGLEVDLLNISRTGMLVETSSRFVPGTATEFQLSGPDTNLAVSARFVRSEVAAVGPLGVKYHAAATFAKELPLAGQLESGVDSAPRAVAELLAEVLGDIGADDDPAALRTKFSRRLRRLIPAQEIQITNSPAGPPEGTESIYFSVPTSRGASAVLQATFEPDYDLSEVEFRLLQTAATLASVVLDLERRHS